MSLRPSPRRATSPAAPSDAPVTHRPVRIDLHCHSSASTEADEALLLAINCPESYSDPADVHAQARRRGMDFVTITDHDSIEGVAKLTTAGHADVLIGEELTCYFPEDGCKIHLLIWGLTRDDHTALQGVAADIYNVAQYVASNRLAHAVAHPLYRQNDLLDRWHVERLVLLFKGFEALNGAHSALHRQAFEPLLDDLTPDQITRLAALHDIDPLWPEPHVKARTGGSDDHGLFNVGRTWTEFPPAVRTIAHVLDALRAGACRPGGEAGSSLKLAHNFFSVGVRYHARQFVPPGSTPSPGAVLMQKLVGEAPPYRRRDLIKLALKSKLKAVGGRLLRPFRPAPPPPRGVDLLLELFFKSLATRLPAHADLTAALADGRAPLAEHDDVFSLICETGRDVSAGIADSVKRSIARGQLGDVFDALPAVAAHQFALLPYYFAFFHQNRERHLLGRLTGRPRPRAADRLRVAAFTDTFDDVNGVSRFSRDIGRRAAALGRDFTVVTCSANPLFTPPWRKNFTPLLAGRLPLYPQLELAVPPVAEVLEWADRMQFDAVYVETPGAMGLSGHLVAAMLRVPVLGTYHTDFPAYVKALTGDFRLTAAAASYMRWFYRRLDTVLSRTRDYQCKLGALGVPEARLALAPPMADTAASNPAHRDLGVWSRLGVREPRQLLYVGRVSAEKNLPMLADVFKRLRRFRKDTALVVAGDGPWMEQARKELAGHPAYFLGLQNDAQLAPLYASSDLFVFPSRTDTMGQVVIEAQASGLPVLVSDEGGPREVMAHDVTGLVLPAADPSPWVAAIHALLEDEPRRQRMAKSGPPRMARFSVDSAFDSFWNLHLEAVQAAHRAPHSADRADAPNPANPPRQSQPAATHRA